MVTTASSPASEAPSAPCVDLLLMEHRHVLLESLFLLSTSLHANRWETALCLAGVLDKFAEVPKGLHSGFSIGLDSLILHSTFWPPNHYKSKEAHDFVSAKYSQEIKLGQVSPSFVPAHAKLLFGHFCTAPLNVIINSGGKLWVTLDLSYPCIDPLMTSINAMIDTSAFKCDWGPLPIVGSWLLRPLQALRLQCLMSSQPLELFRLSPTIGHCWLFPSIASSIMTSDLILGLRILQAYLKLLQTLSYIFTDIVELMQS